MRETPPTCQPVHLWKVPLLSQSSVVLSKLFSLINKKKRSRRILRRLHFSAELPVVPVTIKWWWVCVFLSVLQQIHLRVSVRLRRHPAAPPDGETEAEGGLRGGLTLELRGRTKWRLQLNKTVRHFLLRQHREMRPPPTPVNELLRHLINQTSFYRLINKWWRRADEVMMLMKNQINNLKFIPKKSQKKTWSCVLCSFTLTQWYWFYWESIWHWTLFTVCLTFDLSDAFVDSQDKQKHSFGDFQIKKTNAAFTCSSSPCKVEFLSLIWTPPPPSSGDGDVHQCVSQQWWKTEDAASCSISLEHLHHIKLIPDQFETFTDRQEKRKTLQWCLHSHMSSFTSWPEVCGQSSERFLIFTKM